MISVAMATYNGEKYIRKQLESIVNQSVVPDEIVICDDCSKDKTLEIIDNFVKTYSGITWKVIKGNRNQGYIRNFFNAIRHTTGDIIILSDQDDLWDQDKIKLCGDWFNRNSDMLSLHTEYSIIDQNDNIIGAKQIGYPEQLHKYNMQEFCRRLNYCGMSSAFRAVIKEEVLSMDPDKIPTHDWTIHAISIVNEGMYVSNIVTSYRRYHGDNVALNIDRRTERKGITQRIEVVREFLRYYQFIQYLLSHKGSDCGKTDYIERLVAIQEKRIDYLQKRNIFNWFMNLNYINCYPSIRSYFCDFMYICGIF